MYSGRNVSFRVKESVVSFTTFLFLEEIDQWHKYLVLRSLTYDVYFHETTQT